MSAPVGMVIAGGRSRRYGAPKALELVGGRRIVDRVIDALARVTGDIRLIANDPAIADAIELPSRPDILEDLGALGGIHAALVWASETDSPGIIAVACDMPFLSADLLRHLADRAAQPDAPDVVAPASDGPRGLEPLCAWYGTGCAGAIERAVERGDRRVIGFHGDVSVVTVPIETVTTFGDPAILFMNVNTPADRAEAERIASEQAD